MAWIRLDSRSLGAARYEKAGLVLELEFCDGAIHRYSQVPERTFQELLQAESKGRFFNLQIRKTFPSHPIRPARTIGKTNSA